MLKISIRRVTGYATIAVDGLSTEEMLRGISASRVICFASFGFAVICFASFTSCHLRLHLRQGFGALSRASVERGMVPLGGLRGERWLWLCRH